MKELKWSFHLGLGLLFLLLLSGLVTGPADAPAAALPPPDELHLLPAALPAPEDTHADQAVPRERLQAAVPVSPASDHPPALLPACDANGRLLRGGSYLKSVYLLFRQEKAAG